MDWNDVEKQVDFDDQGKADFRIHTAELAMLDGTLIKKDGEDFFGNTIEGEEISYPSLTLSDRAFHQLSARLKMPGRYVKTLPFPLSDPLFNHHLPEAAAEDTIYLIRSRREEARAILSNAYAIVNNRTIIQMVNAIAVGDSKHSKGFDHDIKDFYLTDAGMWLKMILPGLTREDPSSNAGSDLKVGIMIGNSEVGERSASVEPFVFRQACTNDLVVVFEDALYQRHVYLDEVELERRMAKAIGEAFQVGNDLVDRFIASREIPIEDPAKVLERLSKDLGLTKGQAEAVDDAYSIEPERTVFGVVNALTYAAQQMGPEARVQLERGAGKYLEAESKKAEKERDE